jgi:hypothetical protein
MFDQLMKAEEVAVDKELSTVALVDDIDEFPELANLSVNWRYPALTDIHDRAAKPRKDVQNGDHGAEEETATPVVFRSVQG